MKIKIVQLILSMLLVAFAFKTELMIAQLSDPYDAEKLNNLLKLTAAGNGYSDQTIVVFIPESTWGFDPQYDAFKLPGSNAAPQLYSIIPGHNLAINAIPQILINLKVQLGFKVGVANNYSITASEINTFDPSVTIFLEDTKNDVFIDIKANPVYNFTAIPNDNIERFRLHFRYPVRLDLKVMLEGCFNENDMSHHLNDAGLIPLSQPYSGSPWNYDGTESVLSIPDPDIVDWVLVELRDTTDAAFSNSTTITERKAGFLLKNGSIVDTCGIDLLTFTQTIHQNMYVVIWHRNHLGIISSSSPAETGGIYFYDFTMSDNQAYGSTEGQKEIAPGIFGMIAGDANSDGMISVSDDISAWMSNAGFSGYLSSDINLDGQVNNQDKNDLLLKNTGASNQIPQ